jgi:TPR repeat protein
MKKFLVPLGGLLAVALFASQAQAQYLSPRRYVRPLTQQSQRAAPAPNRPQPVPPGPAVTPPPQAPATVSPADSAKAAAEKEQAAKRLFDYQLKRAQDGSPTAQYDLGVRYLKGDGTEKNPVEARKWLEAAAKQGHDGAKKKLKELDESGDKPPAVAAPNAGERTDPAKPPAAAAEPKAGETPAVPPPAN